MAKWVNVKKALPPEDTDVLLLVKETEIYGENREKEHVYYEVYAGRYEYGDWQTFYCHGCENIENAEKKISNERLEVAYWRPFPKLPKDIREAQEG